MLIDISFGCEINKLNQNLNLQDVKIDNQEKYICDLLGKIVELNKENEILSNLAKKLLNQSDQISSINIGLIREIVSSIAHEINQPLTAIIAYSRGCSSHIKNKCQYKKTLEKLLSPIEKIALLSEYAGKTIGSMMNFIFNEKTCLEKTDINTIINESLSILKYESVDFNIKYTLCFADNLPEINVNKIHIIQVVLNLARNSIDAFKKTSNFKPEIIIKTKGLDRFIVVHVIDNGPGFSCEASNTLTDNFFSTQSKGLGIGLSICRALIEAHGGMFRMKSGIEKGAWFYFTLPIA